MAYINIDSNMKMEIIMSIIFLPLSTMDDSCSCGGDCDKCASCHLPYCECSCDADDSDSDEDIGW